MDLFGSSTGIHKSPLLIMSLVQCTAECEAKRRKLWPYSLSHQVLRSQLLYAAALVLFLFTWPFEEAA